MVLPTSARGPDPPSVFWEESPLRKKVFLFVFLIFVLCWSLVDLQCCVSTLLVETNNSWYSKVIQIMCTHIHSF